MKYTICIYLTEDKDDFHLKGLFDTYDAAVDQFDKELTKSEEGQILEIVEIHL